jgi:hypothetical protein
MAQVANDCAADILEDLHHLFNFAHQIFGELSAQAVDTATRISTKKKKKQTNNKQQTTNKTKLNETMISSAQAT